VSWVWWSDLIVLGLAAKPAQITVNVRPKTFRFGSPAIPNILGSGGLHAPTTFGIKNRTYNAPPWCSEYLQYGPQYKHLMSTIWSTVQTLYIHCTTTVIFSRVLKYSIICVCIYHLLCICYV
jgi:hypothetical protein